MLSPPAPAPQLPTPFIDCQRQTCCSSSNSSKCSSKGSSGCKPTPAQHQQQYNLPSVQQNNQQQQQYMGMPAYPVSICVGQPVNAPMGQQQQQQQNKEDDCCQCTLGWALYGVSLAMQLWLYSSRVSWQQQWSGMRLSQDPSTDVERRLVHTVKAAALLLGDWTTLTWR